MLQSLILTGALGLGIAAVGVPFIANAASPENSAQKLVHATEKTNHQAGDLGSSYSRIIPTTDAEGNPITPEQAQEIEPTPDPRYEQFATPAEHEVREAMQFLNEMLEEHGGPPSQTEYLTAVQTLQAKWQPRYDLATKEYKVLAYRIHYAHRMANEYFHVQSNLTNAIINPESRAVAERNDQAEMRAFLEWREQADETLQQARAIKTDLDDMNIRIAKLVLSANFAAIYEDFQELPQLMLDLHADIEEFERQSQQISRQFGAGPL